jgi:hypothetical protein
MPTEQESRRKPRTRRKKASAQPRSRGPSPEAVAGGAPPAAVERLKADIDETIDKMLAAARRFDAQKIRADQVAQAGGPAEE